MSTLAPHPTHPFLLVRPNGDLEYNATATGDLRRFLVAVRTDPQLILKVKQIKLSIEYDDIDSSRVLEFAGEYNAALNSELMTDEEMYETEVEGEGEDEDSTADEEAGDDNTSSSPSSGADSIVSSSSPFAPASLPTVLTIDSSLDPFETAVDNFKLAKLMAGITDDTDVSDEMYDRLLGELLVVFVHVETIVRPGGWMVD